MLVACQEMNTCTYVFIVVAAPTRTEWLAICGIHATTSICITIIRVLHRSFTTKAGTFI
jgi:hypothetical protein